MEKFELSNKLKEYRKKAGLTQQELANILGIKRSAYAYYEIGKTSPSLETLTDIANLYKITVDQLVKERGLELADKEQDYFTDNMIDDSFLDLSDLEKALIFKVRMMNSQEKKEFVNKLFGIE